MKVFVTGATGVLGRPTLRRLLARGHEVVGLARSDDNVRVLRELGATPARADLFDAESLRAAAQGAEVLMHLATAIPKKSRLGRKDWVTNDRIRSEGTRNLVEVARGLQLHSFVLQSVAFMYGDKGGQWITEDDPPPATGVYKSALDAEQTVLTAYDEFGLPSVVLRGAVFYGAEAWSTRQMIQSVKRRAFPIIGSGEQYWHYVYVEDMARACVRAAENPAPGEVFFVADDWPFHARDLLNYLAAKLHAAPPIQISVLAGRLLAGGTAAFLAQSVRFRTDKIKRMLGWMPLYPTYREGFTEIFAQLGMRT